MHGPDPNEKHPMAGFPQGCYFKNNVQNPRIVVGAYTYYDDLDDSENFERNVLYHFPFIGDRLVFGKFCAIARGVEFIMNGANHKLSGVATHPFQIFGYDALLMPGVRIGDGAVVAARSVVTRDVPPYTVVGGNPSTVIRTRFAPEVVERLQALAWWDWPIETVTERLDLIVSGDVDALLARAEHD